jgi:hypothetical protein
MAIAAESSTSPRLQSSALVTTAESSALPHLQLAVYPVAFAAASVLERSTTIAAIVATAAIAGDAVEGAETMSKQVAMSSLCPSCHILRCRMDAQMLVIFHAIFILTCSDWLNKI